MFSKTNRCCFATDTADDEQNIETRGVETVKLAEHVIPILILTEISSSQEYHDGIVELLEKQGVRILSFYDVF
jgi:hypothetical protein